MRRAAPRLVAAALALGLAWGVAGGTARAAEEGGVAYAIQPRTFLLSHEFDFNVGVLPMDAFYKGVALGASYTYHFGEAVAWEVAQFTYSINVDTPLLGRLRNDFQVEPIPEPRLRYIGTSSLVLKPFFGKMAFSNRSIIHIEMFFVVGGGISKPSSPAVYPTVDIGAGLRFFGWKHVSFRFDVRDYVGFDGFHPKHFLCISIGVSPAFGDIRASREAKKAKGDEG